MVEESQMHIHTPHTTRNRRGTQYRYSWMYKYSLVLGGTGSLTDNLYKLTTAGPGMG